MKREACVAEACVAVAVDALLGVTLHHEGRTYLKARVPLCAEHLPQALAGRVRIRSEFLHTPEKRR